LFRQISRDINRSRRSIMQNLNISLIQLDTIWHNPDENLVALKQIIEELEMPTDVIILPEMFSSGFTMDSHQVSEAMGGKVHNWMIAQAADYNAAICGSIIVKEEENYYNRFLWVTPDGETKFYNKRHLFRMADEHHHYNQGKDNVIIEYKGWRIRPQICYDLRFPVWSRNDLNNDQYNYDVIIYVANWPKPRINAWNALLRARAIENHAYSIGVNRIGVDANDIEYNGQSAVYDFKGNEISVMNEKLYVKQTTLHMSNLVEYRKQFPAQLDADEFILKP
jgi:omega-amidase